MYVYGGCHAMTYGKYLSASNLVIGEGEEGERRWWGVGPGYGPWIDVLCIKTIIAGRGKCSPRWSWKKKKGGKNNFITQCHSAVS